MAREPRPFPELTLNPDVKSVFDFEMEDLTIEGYDPHPAIKSTGCSIIVEEMKNDCFIYGRYGRK